MMADKQILRNFLILTAMFVLLLGCQSEKAEQEEMSVEEGREADIQAIQATISEAITRWHYGDKAVLYENEFEYLRYEMTFDEYLEDEKVKLAEADTVEAINVLDAVFYGSDSADCDVEVVFLGPAEIETFDYQNYRFYFSAGKWIRPFISRPERQKMFEENKRIADSTAEAESEDW